MRQVHTYILLAVLVRGEVHGAERAAADLLLDGVLVDLVVRVAILVIAGVLGLGVERFLDAKPTR